MPDATLTMAKKLAPYHPFQTFVLRSPLLDFSFYERLTTHQNINDDVLKSAFEKPTIKEAIFLASPTLYFELKKWTEGTLKDRKVKRVKLSFLKYLVRMSTRCTPFGLFAGCTTGHWSDSTSILLDNRHGRNTRPDMNYLVALAQDLAKAPHIKKQLKFYPNSSIYVSGDQLRYIEYYYVKGARRHHIVQVDNSEYLQLLLRKSQKGALLKELTDELIDDEITEEEAEEFIGELLNSQLLISELEPSVSGPQFLDQVLLTLEKKKACKNEIAFLRKVKEDFAELDIKLGNSVEKYMAINNFIKQGPTEFELKYLFQTDLELNTNQCTLSAEIIDSVQQVMPLLNKITAKQSDNNLSKFKDAFHERYEEREMSLCHVLDVETGIGYLQGTDSGDVNPLVDDLFIFKKEDKLNPSKLNWNIFYQILSNKISAGEQGMEKIVLTDADFEGFEANWSDLPDTLSGMIEIVRDHEGQKIKLSGFGGSSAANLLGRFCLDGNSITDFTNEIVRIEKQIHPDKILAEIVHLPESRVGNVLMRPTIRSYEIPYLAKSILPDEKQISLHDLYISVRQNRIVLRSKKLNKEIIPRLTNAHNFTTSALPIYQFLCDLQTQNLRSFINFSFGPLEHMHDYLPRVEYNTIVLHEAQWRIKKSDVQPILEHRSTSPAFDAELKKFRNKLNLPRHVLLKQGDNELLIDLENHTSVEMLLESIKNLAHFSLIEFLLTDKECVKSKENYHLNQFVIAFYNGQKLGQNRTENAKFYDTT